MEIKKKNQKAYFCVNLAAKYYISTVQFFSLDQHNKGGFLNGKVSFENSCFTIISFEQTRKQTACPGYDHSKTMYNKSHHHLSRVKSFSMCSTSSKPNDVWLKKKETEKHQSNFRMFHFTEFYSIYIYQLTLVSASFHKIYKKKLKWVDWCRRICVS